MIARKEDHFTVSTINQAQVLRRFRANYLVSLLHCGFHGIERGAIWVSKYPATPFIAKPNTARMPEFNHLIQ